MVREVGPCIKYYFFILNVFVTSVNLPPNLVEGYFEHKSSQIGKNSQGKKNLLKLIKHKILKFHIFNLSIYLGKI